MYCTTLEIVHLTDEEFMEIVEQHLISPSKIVFHIYQSKSLSPTLFPAMLMGHMLECPRDWTDHLRKYLGI